MLSRTPIILASLLLLLAGCTTERHIGGREFPLTITTSKAGQPIAGATAYVIPNDVWIRYGKDVDDPGCRKFIAPYKVTDGPTPVTVYGVPYQMVIIVDWNNHLIRASSPAVPGEHPSKNIEVE